MFYLLSHTRCPERKCELLLVIEAVNHTFFGTPCSICPRQQKLLSTLSVIELDTEAALSPLMIKFPLYMVSQNIDVSQITGGVGVLHSPPITLKGLLHR